MALVKNFKAESSSSNKIALNWNSPIEFNNTTDEIIITRTTSHFPSELFNADFPNRATDSRPVEIFRGKTIAGIDTGTISVSGDELTDTSKVFTTELIKNRLLRDSTGKVFRILNILSVDTVQLSDNPTDGKYVILPDFPEDSRPQENYELDIRTEVGSGFIKNLVIIQNGVTVVKEFEPGELNNLIFKDGNDDRFIIKTNTEDTIYIFESDTPQIGVGMATINSFADSQPIPYIDNFRTESEAQSRTGTDLLDNSFYYYTAFTKPEDTNVAQAEFGIVDSTVSTQSFAISAKNRELGTMLYNKMWPSIYRELDETEDLQDLMEVFGFNFNNLHALIDTYKLQDPDKVLVTAVLPLSEQFGLPSVGFSIGADTLRRIGRDMINCWKLKGSKEGIALFIRKITTWDITNGTADFGGSIVDFLPNVEALRFFDPNLGSLNTRITQTDPFVAGGRFAKTLPGIVIPGFFTFREFVVNIPNVALYVGDSQGFTVSSGTTTMIDTDNNFGSDDSLIGNFLIPNTEEVNDIFEIIGNTATTITVNGVIENRTSGGNFAILSPLNTNRFIILNRLLPVYIPFGTKAGFQFVITP